MKMAFNPVWANEVHIGTSVSSNTWTYKKLCAGIESMSFNSNEQNQQFFFLYDPVQRRTDRYGRWRLISSTRGRAFFPPLFFD